MIPVLPTGDCTQPRSKSSIQICRIHLGKVERDTASFQVNQICRVWISHGAQALESWLALDAYSVPLSHILKEKTNHQMKREKKRE